MNIRQKMIGCGLISILASALLGGLGYWGQTQLGNTLETTHITTVALRNHLEGDMMHDALRADVLAALATTAGDRAAAQQVRTELKEHSTRFQQVLQENAKLPLTSDIHQAIVQLQPTLEQYINQTNQLIERALNETNSARALLPEFNKVFSELEDKNEALSNLIEQQVQIAQQRGEEQISRAGWWLFAGILAVCTLMGLITLELLRSILKPLEKVVAAARSIAQGNLCHPITIDRHDEAGQLQQSLNEMQNNLRQMINNIRQESEHLGQATETLNHASSSIVQSATAEADNATNIAAAMEQMIRNVTQVAEHAQNARELSSYSEGLAGNGGQVILGVVESMEGIAEAVNQSSDTITALGKSSEEIYSIIQVIKGIAEQTNLLALNAAIEAARAGEQGRGFAVVADEVRGLAARTAQTTQENTSKIERIRTTTEQAVNSMQTGVTRVSDGVELARQAGDSINQIRGGAHQAAEVVGEISQTISEQGKASTDVARRVEGIAEMSRQNRMTVQELSDAITLLKSAVGTLQGSVRQFQL